jgi:hypothetical protein
MLPNITEGLGIALREIGLEGVDFGLFWLRTGIDKWFLLAQ